LVSSSNNFSFSAGRLSTIFIRMSLAYSTVICIRCFMVFLLRPIKKCWRRMGSGKARLGPKSIRVLNHFLALPKGLFFCCLKVKSSARSLATL
jgi:hypothetical protein